MNTIAHGLARSAGWMYDRAKGTRGERSDRDEVWLELMKGLVCRAWASLAR